MKKRIYEILEVASPGDKPSRFFDIFIITLIFLNVIAIILETTNNLSLQFSEFFRIFEIFLVIIFTIEYVLRIWSITENLKYKKLAIGRIRFIFTPL